MVDLAAAIEGLDPAAIGCSAGRLGEACAALSRMHAVVVEAIGVFDAQGLWALDQATSMVAWLRGLAGMSGANASGLVLLARKLRGLPATSAALRDGVLSFDQVRTIAGHVTAELVPTWREHEVDLLPVLAGLAVADVHRAMGEWRQRARAALPDPPPHEESRRLHLSELPEGWKLDAAFTVEGGEIVRRAIAAGATADAEGEPVRTAAQQRADGLVDVCRWFLEHRERPPATRRVRPHVDVVASAEDLATDGPARTSSGFVLDAATAQRLACDAAIARVLVRGRSRILDYGHSTRVVPAGLFLALVLRDRHCRWPGCDRTADWCDAHHLVHWLHGGPTEIDNLALLCSRHHHLLHAPGWHAKLDPYDATLWITAPGGRVLTSRPPPVVMATSLFDSG